MSHGGKRKGAGRKPAPDAKQPISARVSPDVKAFLAEQENASETIDETIQRSKAFKTWKAAKAVR
jgi:hypothetical protein